MTTSQDYIEQGKARYSEGNYKQALEYFQAASEADPKCKEAYLLQATVFQKMGNDRLAQSAIYGILMADPTDANATKYLQMISEGKPLEEVAGMKGVFAEVFRDGERFYIQLNHNRVYVELHSNGTASICRQNKEIKGNLIIPSQVIWNNDYYQVTIIDRYAFVGCFGMKSVRFPNSVTVIRESAFRGCSKLTSIRIPNSVTTIGNSAFSCCSGLTSITIPDSVTIIGKHAFSYCSGLTSIVVSRSNRIYDSRNDCNAIIETRSNTIIYGCQTTIIPDTVTRIGNGAFSGCSGLKSIRIPNSVTEIGESAFMNCSGLINIVIPNSVTEIGWHVFRGCSKLTSIRIPDSVTTIGCSPFSCCSGLTSIVVSRNNRIYDSRNDCNAIIETRSNTIIYGCQTTIIPDTVTRIGDGAFSDCSGLTSIRIPDSVTEIGHFAFSDCSQLTSIRIPDSVTAIGINAFVKCSGLTSIVVSRNNRIYDSRNDCNAIIETRSNTIIYGCQTTIIPDTVTRIGDEAFSNCLGLTSIRIPDSVTEIGEYAFLHCAGLTSIKIPDSVTEIGESTFSGCSGLTSIKIPDSVTEIGKAAFTRCSGLTSIKIPDSVTEIGWGAFCGCSGLTSIVVSTNNQLYDSRQDCNAIIETRSNRIISGCHTTSIPDTITRIGGGAFSSCLELTSIRIPNSVTEIEDNAFSDCSGLTSIVIPDSVTKIGRWAFLGCKELTSIRIPDSVTEIGESAFMNCSGLKTIYIKNKELLRNTRVPNGVQIITE